MRTSLWPRATAPIFGRFFDVPPSSRESGAARSLLRPKVRVGIVAPYVVVYEYNDAEEAVLVLRIVHGRRKLSRQMIR